MSPNALPATFSTRASPESRGRTMLARWFAPAPTDRRSRTEPKMADVNYREADQALMDADPRQETPAAREGGRAGEATLHRIVVVGGGAGGLELVTRLGNRLGRGRRASITLAEC